ncbi:hypothetical protein ACFE04_030036 [Oxalis oulophora]
MKKVLLNKFAPKSGFAMYKTNVVIVSSKKKQEKSESILVQLKPSKPVDRDHVDTTEKVKKTSELIAQAKNALLLSRIERVKEERAATRAKLFAMKKTVHFDNNLQVMDDLMKLINCDNDVNRRLWGLW